jgi:protein-disulfide isomerase/uncharacterized membrane protein
MLFLTSVLNPVEQNCANAIRILARQLRIKVSNRAIRKIKEHPTYPSMQSISDVLHDWKVENAGLKIQPERYGDLPVPFIAQVNDNFWGQAFVVVRAYSDDTVLISDYTTPKWKPVKTNDFLKHATGYTLVAEATEGSGDKDYKSNRTKEVFQKAVSIAAVAIILLLCAFPVVRLLAVNGMAALAPAGLVFLKLFGCYISALLLWHEIDQHNPVLQKVCGHSKNINCGAILRSGASKIFGMSWSEIGTFYFAGGLLALLAGGLSPVSVFAIAWLNAIALPYTVFSIYYQWRIAKQWCVLCLAVQGILVAEFLVSFAGHAHGLVPISVIPYMFFVNTLLCFLLPAVAWLLLKPVLQAQKENKLTKSALAKIKYNAEIFNALLRKQKTIEYSTEGLGIVIGPANARNKVIKVSNPYCSHCATAHSEFHDLMESTDDLQLQIIFAVTSNEKDYRVIAAKHLMAIAGKNVPELTKQALDDWYQPSKKNYLAFATRYPMNGELNGQDEKIAAMSDWCMQTQISVTPTIFVNNHQLPENYSVSDLKYFLTG